MFAESSSSSERYSSGSYSSESYSDDRSYADLLDSSSQHASATNLPLINLTEVPLVNLKRRHSSSSSNGDQVFHSAQQTASEQSVTNFVPFDGTQLDSDDFIQQIEKHIAKRARHTEADMAE